MSYPCYIYPRCAEYRYFSRYCIEVRISSIMTTQTCIAHIKNNLNMLQKICFTSNKQNKEMVESTSFHCNVGSQGRKHIIRINRGGRVLQERCQGVRLSLAVVLAHLRLQELCKINCTVTQCYSWCRLRPVCMWLSALCGCSAHTAGPLTRTPEGDIICVA